MWNLIKVVLREVIKILGLGLLINRVASRIAGGFNGLISVGQLFSGVIISLTAGTPIVSTQTPTSEVVNENYTNTDIHVTTGTPIITLN